MWQIFLIMLSVSGQPVEMMISRAGYDTRRDCMRTVRKIERLPDSNPADRYECRRI